MKERSPRRRCPLCDQTFRISQARTARLPHRGMLLTCPTPGCRSTEDMWVHPGDPLTSELAMQDWDRVSAYCDLRFLDDGSGADRITSANGKGS